jgi:hypothetical protein
MVSNHSGECTLLMSGVEQHEAFQVRYLHEVAQHGDTPDYSMVTVEITNNLPVVSPGCPEYLGCTDAFSLSMFGPSDQVGKVTVTAMSSSSTGRTAFLRREKTKSNSLVE